MTRATMHGEDHHLVRMTFRLLLVPLLVACHAASAAAPDERCAARADVSGLPLIERSTALAAPAPRRLAIMLTGDGGWRKIDESLTDRLREAGLPVVGFLTPDYYRTERTAEESSCALERVIRFYRSAWKCDRVVIIGYSRGADVLPFMLNRLPEDVRSSIDLVALLGLEPQIEFHYEPWIPSMLSHEREYPVLPEMQKLRGTRLICFYGEDESNSLCPVLDPKMATIIREPGAHHFGGNYSQIADRILAALR